MTKIKIDSNFNKSADFVSFHGDCLELMSEIPDEFVNLIVTSPPYNIRKEYETKLKLSDYLDQQIKVIEECVRILDKNGSICWQVGNYVDNGEIVPLDIMLYPIFNSLGLKLRNRIIWHFGHGLHASNRFSGRYEVILWFTKNDDYVFNLDPVRIPQKYPNKKHFKGPNKGKLSCNPKGKNPTDIWEIPNVKANHVEKTIHPCQFPVELIERLVLSMTNEGDWVFDPFMGVGTTAIASLINGRKVIGSEIIKEYVEVTNERIKLAEKGDLRIRPRERNIYDPDNPNNIPPKYAYINPIKSKQTTLK
ncbi:MAG: site-specific DNA-methyltransferase [Euryarchaeota archaeon]|nr:site-specific DNA-methyltransferase [Euryarchaeota archaeon]MBU4608524.1 site-specific DNA-methyltransferase [Euryarchaeota archaeon]MBV1754540.1 site-specific DNA-methyltransferase [Methanobacterium sp.]